MTPLELERLDALAVRYARCQDLLAPAMRALARAQLEPKADAGFLALHALMQKQGIVNLDRRLGATTRSAQCGRTCIP
ncbi:MAG: hypothetical protein ACUVQI_02635 [Thermochromatium sp.]